MLIQVILADSTEQLVRDYLTASPAADLVELRLDRVRDLDLEAIFAASGKPRVATCRSRTQGGFFGGGEAERQRILREAIRLGTDYVDLEFESDDEALLAEARRGRAILSYHHRGGTPLDLEQVYRRMVERGPGAILKLIPYADSSTDNLRIRTLLRLSRDEGRDLIAFCMGERGKASRILARAWGSWAVYAPATPDSLTAPGQLLISDLEETFRHRDLDESTPLTGILGHPVAHSLSPLLYNQAFARLEIKQRFLPFEAEVAAEFLPLLSELPISGLSVTAPHKQTMLSYCDDLDSVAKKVGAVNTLQKRWNRLIGYNTDVEGGIRPIRQLLPLRGAKVGILGAGGAARALVYGLLQEGADVTLFARHRSRAEATARELGCRAQGWSQASKFRGTVLIQATPVGMAPGPEESSISWDGVQAEIAYDLVYRPWETRFLRDARSAGARTVSGIEMFLEQALLQFEILSGTAPPRSLFEEILAPFRQPAADPA